MIPIPRFFAIWITAMLAVTATAAPAATNATVDFKELYELLRAHLAGIDEPALNRAAAQGLLDQMKPRVTLIAPEAPAPDTNALPLADAAVHDRAYAYLRVARVAPGLDKALWDAYRSFASSNRLRGLVLDLRFADGQDYAAAAGAAEPFFSGEKPLLNWGQGQKSSTAKSDVIAGPIAVLVNQQTGGAAEALAAVLRQHDLALLIGAPTAGTACVSKEFTLKTGPRVRIAVSPVTVGKAEVLSPAGLRPDIRVEVDPDEERAWYKDAYTALPKPALVAASGSSATNDTTLTGTNRPARRRINEADLVRMLKEGQAPDAEATNVSPRSTEPAQPVLRDPALVRALDLLKALAVVQKFRPS